MLRPNWRAQRRRRRPARPSAANSSSGKGIQAPPPPPPPLEEPLEELAEPEPEAPDELLPEPPEEEDEEPLPAPQASARAVTSTEPSPVTGSYPGPAEYPMVPEDVGTLLSPPTMSWNGLGEPAASWYRRGLALPRPAWPALSATRVRMPANTGELNEVPPATVRL